MKNNFRSAFIFHMNDDTYEAVNNLLSPEATIASLQNYLNKDCPKAKGAVGSFGIDGNSTVFEAGKGSLEFIEITFLAAIKHLKDYTSNTAFLREDWNNRSEEQKKKDAEQFELDQAIRLEKTRKYLNS